MRKSSWFHDREQAGRELAKELARFQGAETVVVGLPRGGVPVAYEVARALEAPLDVCVARKIGMPGQPELGIGAVSEDGAVWVDRSLALMGGLSDDTLKQLALAKRAEVTERVQRYRRGAPAVEVKGKTVVVVDDGVATGGTARAALAGLRSRGAGRLVLAVPVGASETLDELENVADEIVCIQRADPLVAVSYWYQNFSQTSDDTVVELLDRARAERAQTPRVPSPPRDTRSGLVPVAGSYHVRIPLEDGSLEGDLTIPANARGLVLFAHGSGSSRHSSRNRYVASELQREGLATLLFDLLTEDEGRLDARTGHLRFDIDLLAVRLVAATNWALRQPQTQGLPIGYFGASTGAAAALVAATCRPSDVHAVVSRGGRPDLAWSSLGEVKSPTLLLVGSADVEVERLNRDALARLTCEKKIEIIEGATHLFEEPGTLEQVAHSAARWFVQHLAGHALEATA